MSNRRLTAQERRLRSYRNAGAGPAIHADGKGNIRRGQGRNNFPYGPVTTSTGVLTLHKQADRHRSWSPDHTRDPERRKVLEAMTRDELREVCKAQNVKGYGKMNKAELIEAALA